MANKWFSTLKTKWRRITGAAAVVLMFCVPITRAVFANSGNDKGGGKNNVGGNKDGGGKKNAKMHHSDRSCASDRTPPTPSSVSRIKPKSEKSRSHGSRSRSNGKKQHKPKGK